MDFRYRLKLCLELNPVFSEELRNVKLELIKYLNKGSEVLSGRGIEFPGLQFLDFNVTSEYMSDRFYCINKKSNTACDLVIAMEQVLKCFSAYSYPVSELNFFDSVACLRTLHSCICDVNSISKLLKSKPKHFNDKWFESKMDCLKIDADDFGEPSPRKDLAGIAELVSETLNSAKSVLNKKGYGFTIKFQYGG